MSLCAKMAARPREAKGPVPCYRIIILGEPGVGMTSYVLRILKGRFVCTAAAVSLSQVHKPFEYAVDGEDLKVVLEEPAGSERFRSITASFYRHAHAVILMYSVGDVYTFESLEHIARVAKESLYESRDVTWALFGNKCDESAEIDDLEDKVASLSNRITGNSTELDELHFRVSAKTGEGTTEAITKVIQVIHQKQKAVRAENRSALHATVDLPSPADRNHQCCS